MRGLNGKVALVTGAAGIRGMGKAIAVRLAKEGADVVVVDHPQAPQRFTAEARKAGWKGLDSTVEEIQAEGQQGLAVNADISSSSDVENLVILTLRKFGKIDILVNNAAIPGPVKTPVVNLEEEAWKTVLQINLTGPFLLSRAVAGSMVQRGEGGKIIMIASTAGKVGIAGMAAYSVSKAGLISLAQTLALELAQYKINVNTVCPGGVPTDINYVVIEKLAKEKGVSIEEARQLHIDSFGVNIPLGRPGRVDDIAGAVAFLASPDSDYITGQAINVCGGGLVAR
jgi:NAD(P)-dependent dehydrogenase (short-subunit alcohol dehydrogenase family)